MHKIYLFLLLYIPPYGFQCISKAFQNAKCFTDFWLLEGLYLALESRVGLQDRCQIGQKASCHGIYGWPLSLLSPCHTGSTAVIKSTTSSLASTWQQVFSGLKFQSMEDEQQILVSKADLFFLLQVKIKKGQGKVPKSIGV